jgi:hypothetical protein
VKTLRWLLLFLLCLAIPAAFAADVKISALPAASSVSGTDELPANQSGTTRKVTATQIASFITTNLFGPLSGATSLQTGDDFVVSQSGTVKYASASQVSSYTISNVQGSAQTVGAVETWQTLTKPCAANNTVTMATCMRTNGITAGTWDFEYVVIWLAGGTSAGLRLEIGSTMNMNPFRALTTVMATGPVVNTTSVASLSNMGKSGFFMAGWATTASVNVTNTQVLSLNGVDAAGQHEMAIVRGSFVTTTPTTGSLFLSAATDRVAGGGVGGSVQILDTTTLRLRKIN